jgi:serine phosphatase RsbU (regulator of sigma subunit)
VLFEPAFDEQSLEILPDSLMFLYIHGLTEEANDRYELFGSARLHEKLQAHRLLPAQELCNRLVKDVLDYQADVPLHDGITLLAVRVPD